MYGVFFMMPLDTLTHSLQWLKQRSQCKGWIYIPQEICTHSTLNKPYIHKSKYLNEKYMIGTKSTWSEIIFKWNINTEILLFKHKIRQYWLFLIFFYLYSLIIYHMITKWRQMKKKSKLIISYCIVFAFYKPQV